MPQSLSAPPTREGPRERLARVGPHQLSDSELLAILLGTGAPGSSVSIVAERLLQDYGGLQGLQHAGLGELCSKVGLGLGKASRILAALELGRRWATHPLPRRIRLVSSRDVDAALRPRLAHAPHEEFWALTLDVKSRPTAEICLSKGGLSACPVSPAEAFRLVLREAASSVIFVHNHPSGEPEPSGDDLALTERLRLSGELLGIRVVDHVIIAREGYFSFLDAGLLSPLHQRPKTKSIPQSVLRASEARDPGKAASEQYGL